MQMYLNAVSRLKKQYIEFGVEILLLDKSRSKKGNYIYNKVSYWVESMLVTLAKNKSDLGPISLAEEFEDKYNLHLNQSIVWRILKRKKIRHTIKYKRWIQEKLKLYCLDTSGLELQMDASFLFGRSRKIANFDAIDDCSRYIYAKIYKREVNQQLILLKT
jgi:hypothetical protein